MPVFAFTDIEGSTGLWERHQSAMGPVIARHYAILEKAVAANGGSVIKKTGDGIFALFPDETPGQPSPALTCALQLQRAFQAEAWPVIGELRVRMAFHCGQAEEMGGDYYGPTANRCARLMSLGWGGQILASGDLQRQATLPDGAEWQDLGFHRVKDLPEPQQVYGLLHPSLTLRDFPALKSLSSRASNLPENAPTLAGRRRELTEIATLLGSPRGRLVSLLGGAGMGKSRLALQAGLEHLGGFKHGVYRVKLDALDSADGLPDRIADTLKLGLYRQQDVRAQVLDYLQDKQLLLILDPCERLGAGASWISEALEACPSLQVLACSRRRLHLRGEAVVALRGLDYPAEVSPEGFSSSGCARLFVQHVQSFQPGYSIRPADQADFLRLCAALRGLPLGLELAAEGLRTLSMRALADKVEQDPRFLASARQDLPERHRSLKAAFASSWDLLGEAERGVLARLAVFSGGFVPLTAQLVAKAPAETLAALADAGLLEPAAGRYLLPPASRYFAAVKLEEDPARRDETLDLHARHYCRQVKERERNLAGYEQGKAVAELRRDFADIQRAWDRALDRGLLRDALPAARGLGLFTDLQGLARDWEPRLERALKAVDAAAAAAPPRLGPDEAQAARAVLLAMQANLLFSLGRSGGAREKMEKSLALCRRGADRAGTAYGLVRMAVFLGPEDERRLPALEEAAALYDALKDANGAAWARRSLGYLLCQQGRVREGRPMLEESLGVLRAVGNQREIAWGLNALGQASLESGDVEAGLQGLREARDIFLELGDLETAAWTYNRAGRATLQLERWAEARANFEESLRLFGQIQNFRGRALALRGLCEVFAAQGDLASAHVVVDRAVAEAQASANLGGQAAAMMQKGHLLAQEGRLDEALESMQGAQAVFAKSGSELGQAQAMEAQGQVQALRGNAALARRHYEQAAQIHSQAGHRDAEARLCVRLADLESAGGAPDGGEGMHKKALKLGRASRPGDYTLAALMGIALIYLKAGRKLDALNLAVVAEQAQAAGLMPASEPEFYAELGGRMAAAMAQFGSKLLGSVIDEARAKAARGDLRAQVKECVEKYWA